MKNKKPSLFITKEAEFNNFAAKILKEKFEDLQKNKGKINIALSGGSTPMPVLSILKTADLNWEQFNFFMVDERCVSISSEESNFNNLNDSFFRHIPSKSFSMIDEDVNIDNSVKSYNLLLNSEVKVSKKNIPSFDLILLGMGEDGHTASLFPKSKALEESKMNVVKNYVPQLDSNRISLTYPVLKEAKEAIVLIKGKKKRAIVNDLYSSEATQFPMFELVVSKLKLSWIIAE